MKTIAQNLHQIEAQIRAAEIRHGRPPHAVSLLAVSKTKPVSAILEAVAAGQKHFGENYVQEAVEKIDFLQQHHPELTLTWHFIGHLQTNKSRDIARRFDWVHSVDRLKLARRLNDQRPEDCPPLNICLQVNISGEASKSGLDENDVKALALAVSELPRLRLRGLMAIPAATSDPQQQRRYFARLRELQDTLISHGLPLDTLSMGMSGDMEAAIAEGSSIVRIGTAIFGQRPGLARP